MKLSLVKNISQFLVPPGKIARALDWRSQAGSVLSMHVGSKSIDLTVTIHPSQEAPTQPLPSIPLMYETKNNRKVLKPQVLAELSNLVQQWKVCGFVVSWPLQKEGWCGASCGKVLRVLDQIVQETKIVAENRPVCLWDGHHFHYSEDEWGRNAIYGTPAPFKKEVHLASVEQYRDGGMLAAGVARDYIRHHWPDFAYNLDELPSDVTYVLSKRYWAEQDSAVVDPRWVEAYSSSATRAKTATL